MADINNWTQLITKISENSHGIFSKLLIKINQSIKSYQKTYDNFDMNSIQKNHIDVFNIYKLIYEQLLIESDITDIFVEIPSLQSNNKIILNMIGIGKWIKLHNKNTSQIFFFDEEKTIISDKSLVDFINKIEDVREKYLFFGLKPQIYYKFKILPSNDVVEYLNKINIMPLELNQVTKPICYPQFKDSIILDQTIILTLCSNLSYEFEPFYRKDDKKNNHTKEELIQNKKNLDFYLENKIILISQNTYDDVKYKINHIGHHLEIERFESLSNKIQIVFPTKNPRFYYFKDNEQELVSIAESDVAIIVTANQRLCNKIDMYYSEMPYKLFIGTQLSF